MLSAVKHRDISSYMGNGVAGYPTVYLYTGYSRRDSLSIIKTIYSQICISSISRQRRWLKHQNKSACRYNAPIQPGSNRDRIAHGSISRRRIRQDVKAQSQADDGKLPSFSEFPFLPCVKNRCCFLLACYECIQEYQSQRFYRGGLPLCPGSFAARFHLLWSPSPAGPDQTLPDGI